MQMALSQRLQWQKLGFLKPTRRFSSSTSSLFSAFSSSPKKTGKSTPTKKAEAAKEQRAAAIESFVKTYMEMHPGIFPKATQVQHEVGGSYYLVKDILKELKEKMISNPHIQIQSTSEKIGVTVVDTTDIEARMTGESLDTADLSKLKGGVQTSEGAANPLGHEKDISTDLTHVTAEKSFEAIVKSEDHSNYVRLVESGDGDSQLQKENSSTSVAADRDHKVESTAGSFFIRGLVSGEGRETRAFGVAGSSEDDLIENGFCSPNKNSTSYLAPNGSYRAKHMASSSDRAVEVIRLADIFMKKKADGSKSADNDTLTRDMSSGFSKESLGDDDSTRKDIKGLIDRIKELPVDTLQIRSHDHSISSKTNRLNNEGLSRNRSPASGTYGTTVKNLDLNKKQKPLSKHFIHDKQGTLTKKKEDGTCDGDQNKRDETEKVPFEEFSSEILSDVENGSSSDNTASDYTTPKPSPNIPLPYKRAPQKRDPSLFLFTAKGSDQTNVLVRFLRKSTNATEIEAAFGDCGPITGIRFIPSRNKSWFKDAYICFKTKEGMQKALAKTDVNVGGADVVAVSASQLTNMPNRIAIPNLIGDLDVPASLIDNPTRTVMLKGLPQDLTSHHLREAFSFCGGHITGFFMGSSSSVAYIEFETDDAKEKAIAASSISVSGKPLAILRIDTPRTTVIRINNVRFETGETNVRNICNKHGQVKRITRRGLYTMDVHFKLAEWPNMLNILNSLNGLVVNDKQWIAVPAPVIPVEILQILWNEPDGRELVCALIQNLSRKLGENPIGMSELCTLANQYYGE